MVDFACWQGLPVILIESRPLSWVPNRRIIGTLYLLGFPASNNEAEHEAILFELSLAITLSASKVRIYNDSQLVVGHIQKEYEAKDERMIKYMLKVRESLSQLDEWAPEKVPKIANTQADALAGIASSLPIKESILLPIYVQMIPSITESHICNTVNEG